MSAEVFNYAAMQATVDRLIAKFGATASLRRQVLTGGASPWEPSTATIDYATKAAVVNFPRWYSAFAGSDTDVLRTDRLGLVSMGPLAALGITTIVPLDSLVHFGKVYSVIDAKPVAPAGLAAVYLLQLRI